LVPDVIGPVDGSARLTILTEGNHFPVLLPLVFDAFPEWCRERPTCDLRADEILVVTLPQYMVVAALEAGGTRFGNLRLPLAKGPGRVWPDVVIGGVGPLSRLSRAGIVQNRARVLARHRGMAMLLRRDAANRVAGLRI
jgi:hypothetical protein